VSEVPSLPPIESVWFVEATYAPDAAEARVPFRAVHIAHLRELKASGAVVEAGAFADVSSSVMIVRAGSEAEALALFRNDIYMLNGIWVEIRARAFGRVRDGG
jgi:uncharacterized protein YciI